jgi:hypothetical protein
MATQNVILVAGFNYENANNPAFLDSCNNRMTRLLAKSTAAADMVFTLFDVGGGLVKQSAVNSATKKRAWTNVKTFTAVTTANYSPFVTGQQNHFNQSPAGIMSITDVYAFVQNIGGGADKGTLAELSFFTHGWQGGPILVNTRDPTSLDPTQPRNADDKDARLFKDFIAPTMDTTPLANFKGAFSPTGIIWTWGCSFVRAGHIVLSRLFKTSKFRSTPSGKIKDTDTFDLDFSVSKPTPTLQDFNSIVNDILPGGTVHGNNYTVTKSFLDIKNAFKTLMANTYSAKISAATGAKVFAALPGTYADQEKGVKLPLMLVPTKAPPYDDNLTANLAFYKTVLGVILDPENRGYGTF